MNMKQGFYQIVGEPNQLAKQGHHAFKYVSNKNSKLYYDLVWNDMDMI